MAEQHSKEADALIARLRDRIDELDERVRQLTELLRGPPLPMSMREVMTGMQETIAAAIIGRHPQLLTRDACYSLLYSDRVGDEQPALKVLDVVMCKVRKNLKTFGIEIETFFGRGWRISDESRVIVDELKNKRRQSMTDKPEEPKPPKVTLAEMIMWAQARADDLDVWAGSLAAEQRSLDPAKARERIVALRAADTLALVKENEAEFIALVKARRQQAKKQAVEE